MPFNWADLILFICIRPIQASAEATLGSVASLAFVTAPLLGPATGPSSPLFAGAVPSAPASEPSLSSGKAHASNWSGGEQSSGSLQSPTQSSYTSPSLHTHISVQNIGHANGPDTRSKHDGRRQSLEHRSATKSPVQFAAASGAMIIWPSATIDGENATISGYF